MKKLALAMTILMGTMTAAHAGIENCATKRTALEKEIRIAQQYGNAWKVASLKKALAEINAHCSDASVKADAQKKISKLERKVVDKQGDIAEVRADLQKAQAKGDLKKVAKYQRKLAEKQADLKEIQAELKAARQALAGL